MPGLFISYRRSDNPDAVGRIYDRLVAEFGKPAVFKDVDSIPLGQDFRGHLNDIVGNCAAVLAIIGPKWADIRDETGRRRLEDPDDFVRIELEAALARNVPVVPVLVGHAAMPATSQLPASLSTLAFRQAVDVRPDPDFHHDSARLVSALRAIIDPNAPTVEPVEAVEAKQKARAAAARTTLRWLAALAAAASLAAVAFAIPALKHLSEVPPPQVRTEIVTPGSEDPTFALSPDGRMVVYVARDGDATRLWLRNLSSSTGRPLAGTDGATAPFWAPDSQSIGFFAGTDLRRIDLASGQVRTLAPAGPAALGAWNTDGVILYNAGPANPLLRVAADGGSPQEVVSLNEQHAGIRQPVFLPDGKRFLFQSIAGTEPGIYLGSLSGAAPVKLASGWTIPGYLPEGWLLQINGDTLQAQRLDLGKSALMGDPISIANQVGAFSASATGLIAYRAATGNRLRLNWRDRRGNLLGTAGGDDGDDFSPAISPDGGRVAIARRVAGNVGRFGSTDIWALAGSQSGRITTDGRGNEFPVWSPDGERILHLSLQPGSSEFHVRFAGGEGTPDLLLDSPQPKFPSSWSADGRYLAYFTASPETRGDLVVMPIEGDREPVVLLATRYFEVWPRFSPDGRWLAYQSDESGRGEVYVRPFVVTEGGAPKLGPGRWQVSNAGGIFPVWRHDGRELFFLGPAGEMMASAIEVRGDTLVPGTPVKLFDTRVFGGGSDNATGRQYDVAPDGRFLINENTDAQAPPITLLQNWRPPSR
jgi:Tol biopolymer transport system component